MVRLNQILYDQLLIVPRLNICHEDLIWKERLDVFLLVCEDIRLLGIFELVVDHAPDWRITGSRHGCDDLNCMLAVEHIVDTVTSADFHRVDLIEVKMLSRPFNMGQGQVPLIFLVGNQILDGYLLKMYIRYKLLQFIHDSYPPQGP